MKVRAKRSLGQNFLQDENVIEQIVGALDLEKKDTVIEIGPGLGALTRLLIERAGQMIAVEFDRDMIGHLSSTFKGSDTFQLINADALSTDFASLLGDSKQAKLVANLPYNISTPILQRLIEYRHLFETMVLMFQREVVDRITARPGTRDRGYLTILVQNSFEITRLFDVPPTAFSPVPKVWSSVVRLTPRETLFEDNELARKTLSDAFAQKRKTLLNNLKDRYPQAAQIMTNVGIDPKARAETLELAQWAELVRAISKVD